jgi:hypothetical protein
MTQLINIMELTPVASNHTELKTELRHNFFHKSQPQTIIAQQVNDPDVMGQMGTYLKNFVETGQVWALLVGLVLGFVFRGIIGR